MKPTTPLKLTSIAFAVVWTAGMLWSSGSIDLAQGIILPICGTLAGIGWYFSMRWVFRFIHLLPPNDRSANSGAGQ